MSLPKIHGETARLWADPELRFTPQGKAACQLPLVFSKRKKNEQGVWEDAGSMFVRGTVWDQQGENTAESLIKGDEVIVTGELYVREYERRDGSKGSSFEMNVWAVGPSLKWNPVDVKRPERGQARASATDPFQSAPSSDDAPF